MEFIGGIFWLIWLVGLFFIRKSAKQKERQRRFELAKNQQTKKKNQFSNQEKVTSELSDVEKRKVSENLQRRNQRTQYSARLQQEATKKRNHMTKQSKKPSIKEFVDNVQMSQQSKDNMDAYLDEDYDDSEKDLYRLAAKDAYSIKNEDDEIDWESYETDLFDDSEWNYGEAILQEPTRKELKKSNTTTNERITLNGTNIKQGIILSEILSRPKSRR